MTKILVPPIKCQGIKTKLVPLILANAGEISNGKWIEPFMGSCVVGLNTRCKRVLFADQNPHLVNFYSALRSRIITPEIAKRFLVKEGSQLEKQGEQYYYNIRARFNETGDPLDFLFLSRACFNGLIRFNSKGKFNVPFCRKPERFAKGYITKIVNQIAQFQEATLYFQWDFACSDFEKTVSQATADDMIYCDPPYLGRHVDYFDSWSEEDENRLFRVLSNTKAKFILSTWHSNQYRENKTLKTLWSSFHVVTKEHFYHVGARESNRSAMLEALVMNFVSRPISANKPKIVQTPLFD
ncbi:MAG: Dam family site-specific DNA-(adenine-N6)-methyltransferase [Planctomycetaceae bacterium]|jgi:DNA adenine methylase|nr:Dam family site-specific DNA-(adenine-N6)-methyltransferase [Planctomycetaceae bacterium]